MHVWLLVLGLLPCVAFAQYNYDEVLRKSILFYEAQRSGRLPSNNRIPWRGDSALQDRGQNGEDLTGGWYDAGDHVKFGFPLAWTVTTLAWGLVEYRTAYQRAGELDNMLDSLKWPLDYFIKCHVTTREFYGQVGDGNTDHAYWGRAEDMNMRRPAWKITPQAPGSDLAAETAAAMTASSIAFRQTDSNYADLLLRHARQLYELAYDHRGKYTDSITNARDFYGSTGYRDELAWGAIWLHRATNEAMYLNRAREFYDGGTQWAFSWDAKYAGVQVLMYRATRDQQYAGHVEQFLRSWMPGGSVRYTPKGLAWRDQWGPLRYVSNSAFIALVAADLGIMTNQARDWARGQIHYALGDTGRSYVVGFGRNPPQRPHHRGASCPNRPAPCGWEAKNAPGPNPQVLHGALVGGPGQNDDYVDDRNDYIKNEVATDYNAGFQSAVAGVRASLDGGLSTTTPPIGISTTPGTNWKYNYNEALGKSILFYEAQRSGRLPSNNRIPWRGDSALNDKGQNNEDLTGGWYDAGDHVKFGFPMAWGVTILAWGLVEYRSSYEQAGELNNMLDSLKWPLDYFIKCHVAPTELYGQVGDPKADHAYWGRASDMTMERPAWKITAQAPGSDLAAETAAAMAASSIAFRQTDSAYADTLLQHARQLYDLAYDHRGKYTDVISSAREFYISTGFYDELAWGAIWLYRATNESTYLDRAREFYDGGTQWSFFWDAKYAGVQVLMYRATQDQQYKGHVEAFLQSWLPGGGVTYTPKGLAWREGSGPLRYSANTAFIALVAADLGIMTVQGREFAMNQTHYILGDGGRSYMVGFGNNPPQKAHHRGASCPNRPAPCGWAEKDSTTPNPQVLNGALVGGPGRNDDYVDDRNDYTKNEVTVDYNAGLQSAIAGIRALV